MSAQNFKGPESQPDDQPAWPSAEPEVRRLFIDGRHLEIKLDRFVWGSLEEISDREDISLREIFEQLSMRSRSSRPGVLRRAAEIFSVSYFRQASAHGNSAQLQQSGLLTKILQEK